PEIGYPYCTSTAGRYGGATAAPRALAVAPGAEPRAARVLPPLLPARGALPADTLSRRFGWQGWLALLLVPPLIALFASRRWRRAPAATVVTPGPGLTPLGRLEREFLAVLASHVSDPFARDGDGLAPAPRAEALFAAGALRAAADSFAARAAREPRDPAHWYNLGATLYRAGADGKATTAWIRAARLAPRDPVIRRALRLLPAPDPVTERMLSVGWATPAEWGLVAAAGWVLLWLTVAGGGRPGVVLALFGAVAIAASLLGALEW